jgi:spermidine synthase
MNWLSVRDREWLPIYKVNDITPEVFKGSVLYLGMGSCLFPRLQNESVTKTTIVELEVDVINWNRNRNYIKEEWNIINQDAFEFETEERFDMIFIDIFYQTTTLEIMNLLLDKYSQMLNNDGTILFLSKIIK